MACLSHLSRHLHPRLPAFNPDISTAVTLYSGSLRKFIIYPLVYVIIYFKNNIKINNGDKSFQNIYNGELHNQKFCLASATCHYACTGTL